MKPRYLLNFVLIVALISSFSCKKENEGCKTMRYHPKDFLDYWYFPQGSWWVYQRIDTVGMIDTLYCFASSKIEDSGGGDEAPGCSLIYIVDMEHSNKLFVAGGGGRTEREWNFFSFFWVRGESLYVLYKFS